MIRVQNLGITQGTFSLHDISFAVEEGQYAVLTGRSGSGKTTMLEAICGLRRIQTGRVLLGDVDVTRLRPAERRVGYVPQDGALFPNYRVGEQLAFALIVRRHAHQAINERVKDLAQMLKITHLLDRYPDNLSGGEK